ncbi:MAG: hypothetical protein LIP12_07970, partial [Clostridiales bacterium]|nr:hypothetical protein [Clostridiales bacterium]
HQFFALFRVEFTFSLQQKIASLIAPKSGDSGVQPACQAFCRFHSRSLSETRPEKRIFFCNEFAARLQLL